VTGPLIAFAGLATSHPYTDAGNLPAGTRLVVWEEDAERLARFRAAHPDALVAADPAALLAYGPDGVILTVPTPRVAGVLAAVLERDLPCFVNKPAAATPAQLAALDAVVLAAPHRVLSTSVLRFAPGLESLGVDRERVLAARVTVRHDVSRWSTGFNRWQDEPSEGGGMLVLMGLHGVELLTALLGERVELAGAVAARRHYPGLRSEDTALLALRYAGAIPASVEVLGVAGGESYEVTVYTVDGEQRVVLSGGVDTATALGYRATIAAFLAMTRGAPSPVPWPETKAVLAVLVAARERTAGTPAARERTAGVPA
jgi:predicted dehydrogenase